MKNNKITSIILALLAAIFYAVSIPVSKLLLNNIAPTFLASFLYLGAGFGMGMLYLLKGKSGIKAEKLSKKDFPYIVGMIVLDIIAPILLMVGISVLLNNIYLSVYFGQ